MTSRIVIIGGGQAGGWAAKTLRDEGFEGEICVVAEEAWDFYERPPLSKASLLEPDAALPRLFSEEAQQALDLTWYRPLRAEQIDRQTKTVRLSNGTHLSYNILLIATGGRARLPGEAWAAHPQVYTLRHWQDAQRLKGRLAQSKDWRLWAAAGSALRLPPPRAKTAWRSRCSSSSPRCACGR